MYIGQMGASVHVPVASTQHDAVNAEEGGGAQDGTQVLWVDHLVTHRHTLRISIAASEAHTHTYIHTYTYKYLHACIHTGRQ
jgi:hypothetical protein